jgi:hypothetical protein
MHETARCIGYPSDSTRAAREQGRGATCGHRLCWPGPARPAGPHLHRPRLSPCGSSPTLAPVAQVSRSPLWIKTYARPRGSSLTLAPVALLWPASGCGPGQPSPPTSPLAPVAQVSRSPLWLKSHARPCGSTLAPVALLWPASGSAQLPLVMGVQPGCVLVCRIAGPYRHCRPRWVQWGGLGPGLPYVDRRLHRFLGGPATVGAGPLMCADSWAVTVWRIASAARLRQSRGHRTERGQPVSHQHGTTAVALSAKLASGACRPARCPGAGGDRAGRHRARQSQLLPTALIGQRPDHARHFTRPVACSPPADPRRLGCGPGQPDLAATTTRGHDTPRPDP